MSDFRIILHMHYFFEDHRSQCRLFITSKIKTIKDLQKHISNLFDLKTNFYLISNNLYLPHLEDVRVLREDDLVIAIPSDRRFQTNEVIEIQNVVDKPLKRGRTVLLHESESGDLQEENSVKKKKKRKDLEIEEVDCVNNERIILESKQKKKKKKELSVESSDIEEKHLNEASNLMVNYQGEFDVYKKEQKTKKKSVEVPVYNPRFPCIVPRKNIALMEISTKPKVIKAILVNDSPNNLNYKQDEEYISTPETLVCGSANNNYKSTVVETNNGNVNESKIFRLPSQFIHCDYKNLKINNPIIEENHIKKDVKEIFAPPNNTNESQQNKNGKKINIISVQTTINNEAIGPQLIPVLQNTVQQNQENLISEIISPQLNSLEQKDELECAPKFKDHTYSAQINPLLDSKEPSINTPSESIVSTATEEESGVDVSLVVETKRKRKRVRKRKQKNKIQENVFQVPVIIPKPIFTPAAPVMHIRFENDNQKESNKATDDHSSEIIDSGINYDKFCKEEILQYPIMYEKLPKQADIIAFKICRLSESYTPEISDVIIAKVLNYCPSTKDVTLKILEGADECAVPEGKFYMELGDDNVEVKEKSFSWNELIEPRLLFP